METNQMWIHPYEDEWGEKTTAEDLKLEKSFILWQER